MAKVIHRENTSITGMIATIGGKRRRKNAAGKKRRNAGDKKIDNDNFMKFQGMTKYIKAVYFSMIMYRHKNGALPINATA